MSDRLHQQLQSAGYSVSANAKGRYIKGLIRLMGDLTALTFLRDEYMIRLLSNAQLRKEKAFTYKQLHQIANPAYHTDRFYSQMQTLIAKGMFLRGYNLACPVCDLDAWYSLMAIDEHVTCQGCRFEFQMPLTLPFAYRPNRLLVEALKSGALTILLTALWLYEHDETMQWQTESVVHQGELMTDIDIAVQMGDAIWLIECKDNFKTTEVALIDLIAQLKIGQQIAQDIGASRYLFSTLYSKPIPDPLLDFLKSHQIESLGRADLLCAL